MTDTILVEVAKAAKKAMNKAEAAIDLAERALSIAPQTGPRGETGKMGSPGERGLPGKNGRDGVNGRDGAPGRNGSDGKDGQDGEGFKWRGLFVAGLSYAKGDVVRHEGSAWVFKRGGGGANPASAGAELMVEKGNKGDRGEGGGVAFLGNRSHLLS